MTMELPLWPYAWGGPIGRGLLKTRAVDFNVVEALPETPSGEGEHLWLTVEKTGQNTAWVARQLAKWADIPPRAVSYAGLKDRHAVTVQTFSLHLPGQADPLAPLALAGVRVLAKKRHIRKLKTGQLIGNHFDIRLRSFQGSKEALTVHWQQLVTEGFPNYFGPQRFGEQGANLERALLWFRGESKLPRGTQGIHLSAVRGYLFNSLLARRVEQSSWNQVLPGDFMQFREGQGGFICEHPSEDDLQRLASGVISPTASLPGVADGRTPQLEARESDILDTEPEWLAGLVRHKMQRGLRKLRVYPEQGELTFVEGDPRFRFFLPAGSYATVALRELVEQVEGDKLV